MQQKLIKYLLCSRPKDKYAGYTEAKDIILLVSYLNKKDFDYETMSNKLILLRATMGKAMHLHFN